MFKYSSSDISQLLKGKQHEALLNSEMTCFHHNIVKSYRDGRMSRYVCMECGMISRKREAFLHEDIYKQIG